jgi:hypothetical protein
MATQQSFLVCDSSTLANFKNWAQTVSSFFTTAGWVQSSDTGQVNWGTIVSVPGSGAYVYEIWQPNDGLTTFYLKVEYGNATGSANSPSIRLTLSSATNGSGTPTGFVSGPFTASNANGVPSSAVSTYECDFFGNTGMISVLMWRSASAGSNIFPCAFNIERSRDSSGNATSTYVTIYYAGNSNTNTLIYNQQSIVFGIGAGLAIGGISVSVPSVRGTGVTGSFNGAIPIDLVAPYVGYFDQNCTGLASGAGADFTEGVTFNATVYGATMTYMPTKITPGLSRLGPLSVATYVICVRTA